MAIINQATCVGSDQVGTGTKNCKIDLSEIKVPVLIKRGTTFGTVAAPDNIDLAYIQQLQVDGKAIVFPKGYSFTQNINEDSTEENPDTGAIRVTRVNPYDFTIMFENGIAWNKAVNCYNSFDSWDLAWFDKNDNFVFTESKSAVYKGFTLGMFQTGKYTFSTGTTTAKNTVRVQLSFPEEFDKRVSVVEGSQLDFSATTELDGVNDLTVTVTAPADTDTAILFNVKDVAVNNSEIVLAVGDVEVLVNGVADAGILTAGVGTGDWVKTVSALTAGDTISVRIPRALIGECVFESKAATTITTA